jgi:XTP/dITP diphosphohydrolase
MRILFATGNAHKVEELQDILGPGCTIEARDTGVEETGSTFEENALLKARALAQAAGELALADDSGIAIDHLDGAPGIHSARWTGGHDWIGRVLRELEGVEPAQRTCRYVCAAAAVWPDGREVVVRGEMEGTVVDAPRGDGGFGYDPIVAPVDGDGRTFGEMSANEKHAISHRARAFLELVPRLTE